LLVTTSYFAKIDSIENPVSIARSEPRWFRQRPCFQAYKKLAPSWSLVGKAKQGRISQDEYARLYRETVLDRLDPLTVLRELYESFGSNPTLLCWEAKREACHRRLVAQWLEVNTGVHVPEID